jgi:putative tryptophan/tyrosine transport system substrate-binding protein
MRRREFIALAGGASVAWSLSARAQQLTARVYRVGGLAIASREQELHYMRAFEEGLRSLGYRIGENVVIEWRFAEGKLEQLPSLAGELVQLGVDVMVTASNANTVAAMRATTTIPIVMALGIDPIGAGLVASLRRPGGNVTGLAVDTGSEIFGKRFELLKEIFPELLRVGILWNPDFGPNRTRMTSMGETARTLGLTPIPIEARGLNELEHAFATMVRERAQAFVMLGDGVLLQYRGQIGSMALKNRLPAASALREDAEAGLLLAYGADFSDQYRKAAGLVDKIFKGAKPADLPIQQPTKFLLVVNIRTAKALGLEMPATLLARADEVIE